MATVPDRPIVASPRTCSMRRAVPAAALLAAATAGCAFTSQPIPGFTVEEGKTTTQTVDRIQAQFGVLGQKVMEATEPGMERWAVLRVLDRYVGMAVESAKTHTGLDPYDFVTLFDQMGGAVEHDLLRQPALEALKGALLVPLQELHDRRVRMHHDLRQRRVQ